MSTETKTITVIVTSMPITLVTIDRALFSPIVKFEIARLILNSGFASISFSTSMSLLERISFGVPILSRIFVCQPRQQKFET